MDRNDALDRLLLVDTLDDISRLQVHQNRVPRILDLMVQTLDLAERGLQAIPLRRVLVTTGGDGDGIGECGVVAPESELGKRRAASE